MSLRELRALSKELTRTRTRSGKTAMEEDNFQAETEEVSLQEALEKIREQEQEITKAVDRERQLRADLERT